jgi:hypothetical protein
MREEGSLCRYAKETEANILRKELERIGLCKDPEDEQFDPIHALSSALSRSYLYWA